ncbi:Non-ribosomal peptide synthetase [Ceratobasidium sp. 414]|nr:Non-ribosomal peptide synthetase [Ceratobasidium sp. 414]
MVANPASDSVALNAAFMEDISTADVDELASRVESCMELFCGAESSSQPISSPLDVAASFAPTDNSTDPPQANDVDPKLEKILVSTVASFLNVESSLVGHTSSLVALGLTPLKSVALSRKLKESGLAIAAIDIIQADTVRGITSKCGHGPASPKGASEGRQWLDDLHLELRKELAVENMRLTPEDQPQILCATALQAGMLSQTIGSNDRLYVHGFTFKLRADCSIERLKSTWQRMIQETSILRTSFAFAADLGRWVQVVHSEFDLPWSSNSFSDPSSALAAFVSTLPFRDVEDFAQPPIHLCHFKFDDDDYLLVVLHHALCDGISLPLLFDQVRFIYHDAAVPPSVSFHESVPEILAQEHSGVPYWTKQLKGVQPFAFPRITETTGGAWRSSASCEIELSDIKRICRRYQVNVQCLGQAAMAKILSQVSGQRDVVFGQVISGRMLPDAETVIGPVFNTIPCHIDISTSRNYGDLLRKIQRSNNESLPYQHASLRSIQSELAVKSLTDALFLFQPDAAIGSAGSAPVWDTLESTSKDETKAQYGLNVELHQDASGFVIRASCRASVMDRETLSNLSTQFSDELRKIILRPTSPIFDAPPSVPVLAGPRRNSAAQRRNNHAEQATVDDSGFDGWSDAQLKSRDLLVAFTKVPSSAVRPSSQLASLGLDSISVIQLAGLAKRAGVRLSATDVAGSTTLADVAAIITKRSDLSKSRAAAPTTTRPLLDGHTVNKARLAIPASLRDAVENILPTTPGMDFMLSSWNRSGGWRFQHVFAFKVSPGVNAPKLRIAWDKLVERHAILRSVFVDIDGQNVLCVLKPGSIQTPWTNVIPDGKRGNLEEVGWLANSLLANPPQLRGGPAASVTYLHGKESDYMILSMHHALYDAWSFNILLRDLENIYRGRPLTSRDDLAYLARVIASPENRNQQHGYWQSAFDSSQTSIVEFNTSQVTTAQSSKSSRQLQRHAQIPLILLSGVLRTLLTTRERVSQRARRFLTSAVAVVDAYLSILALARVIELPRPLSCDADATQSLTVPPQTTRMHSISRDLVLGFSALQAKALERNLPLHMVLLACWAKAQAKCSNSGSVVFGLVHNGLYVRNDTFVMADQLRADLKLRSPVVEQSRLQDVSAWVGSPGKPLLHYFVNLLRVPSSVEGGEPCVGVLERIKVGASPDAMSDHSIVLPQVPVDSARLPGPGGFQVSSNPPFQPMEEVLGDCMVEIFFDSKKDSIGMEMTCQRRIMTESEAQELAEVWAREVRDTFSP